jgi:AraC-like DNA-binding protein
MKYINESFSSPITLDSLSCKYSLSRSFFSRKFREVTGFGLSEYITVVRIKNAARLLAEKKMNVTEAAFAVGYNDSSYFTSSFKKIMGVTPLKYSKNNSIH